ncbi:hypothetical protein L207DRAFT_441732 [Hyaloscypha variabilis F]|uniref:Uncharacterized protein n=1 Tax=Hyaloscypha variabilis (strain UAMH 11265 / GT02V1 / F) TaxID=1149755 RepID=A0A2J6QZT8_HYAVF|nr:hypothetical protein L207DRAFT_441732 [Hyaloscypha variabilis F]
MPGPTLRKLEILELFRDELQVSLPPATDQFLSDAVDFVARLLLMMDIGRHRQGLWVINQDPINWSSGSLSDLIATQFDGRKELDTPVRLERIFIAPNLELIGGIKIVWTDNLADHLRMSEDDTQVSIFSHINFLKMNLDNPLFPPGFMTETIRTLALLLPRRDAYVRSWLQKQQRLMELHNRIDRQAASEGRLKAAERQITKFVFWHDRLVILKQAFDESQPKNLRQWWNDRRNPVQWYNFWFAVALIVGLTVFFGVAATVEGAIQVYKAYHPSPSP